MIFMKNALIISIFFAIALLSGCSISSEKSRIADTISNDWENSINADSKSGVSDHEAAASSTAAQAVDLDDTLSDAGRADVASDEYHSEPAEELETGEKDPDTAADPGGESEKSGNILLQVPFTPQAPFGDWEDQRQQDGCEEAAALMAVRWAQGRNLSREEALSEIIAISDYEEKKFGSYSDTDAEDTIARIFIGYFGYTEAEAAYDIDEESIITELEKGNVVIVPANGRKLKNPFYTPPGPDRHNLLIRGYDRDTDEFITNDPGTKRGEGYRYRSGIVIDAIVDYPTGDHLPIKEERKAMIVVDGQ
jgi:hypothetical protein